MTILSADWNTIAAMLTVLGIVSALVFMLLRSKLAADFVTRAELHAMQRRLETIEAGMSQIPRHADLMALERRLGEVSNSVAAITAFSQALKDDTGSIKHQLNMLIEAQLTGEKQ